jgi:hypothetical protein
MNTFMDFHISKVVAKGKERLHGVKTLLKSDLLCSFNVALSCTSPSNDILKDLYDFNFRLEYIIISSIEATNE